MEESISGRKKEKNVLVSFKILPNELQKIQRKADKFTQGNVSEWLRISGMNHQPTKIKK